MGLTDSIQKFIRCYHNDSVDKDRYSKIFQTFQSDPGINPNWSIKMFNRKLRLDGQFINTSNIYNNHHETYLWHIINSCGTFEELLYIFRRPGFNWSNHDGIIFFTELVTPAQIIQLIALLREQLVPRNLLSSKLTNVFGFRLNNSDEDSEDEYEYYSEDEYSYSYSESEYSDSEDEDEVGNSNKPIVKIAKPNLINFNFFSEIQHYHPPKTSRKLGPKCPCCLVKTKRTEIRISHPGIFDTCKCYFHLECALKLAVSFIRQIKDPNSLDRTIIGCPGCQAEIRPSFLFEVKKQLGDLGQLLKIDDYLPKDFLKTYKLDLQTLIELDLNDLNKRIFGLNFSDHPKFVACPRNECQGFVLIEPETEKYTKCLICQHPSLFIGKLRQLEIQKESPEIKKILSEGKIRPCYNCGKLIEKNGGCPNMVCKFCHQSFRWDNALDYQKYSKNLTVHF